MEVRTYRAGSVQEALQQVRQDLGPEAAVLHTQEVPGGLLRWMTGRRQVEVTASLSVNVPSRFSASSSPRVVSAPGRDLHNPEAGRGARSSGPPPADRELNYRQRFREAIEAERPNSRSLVEDLCRPSATADEHRLPQPLSRVFTDLIRAEVDERLARELLDRARNEAPPDPCQDVGLLKERMVGLVEEDIFCRGPIEVTPGRRKLVALVGPTGVGKTTTIAKLAANFHLRERHRVGLITVDTYRIAAVDQLRTYADIISLPMEIVSTPLEMRAAADRMADLDLVLLDTAGRSPRDEVRLQELKSILAEAQPEETHLVLSSLTGAASMQRTADRFSEIGTTAIVVTKLDEANGLGNLMPLVRHCRLPISYVTNGQNVPDDIATAERRQLARMVLGMEADK